MSSTACGALSLQPTQPAQPRKILTHYVGRIEINETSKQAVAAQLMDDAPRRWLPTCEQTGVNAGFSKGLPTA